MQPALIALFTILGGAITFALGQIIVRGAIAPALDLKKLLGLIDVDLDIYEKTFTSEEPTESELRDKFERHGYALRGKLRQIIWYPFFRRFLRLPAYSNLLKASAALIGHSHQSRQVPYSRRDEIKALLEVRTGGWFRLAVFASFAWVPLSIGSYFGTMWAYPSRLFKLACIHRLYDWVQGSPQQPSDASWPGAVLYPVVNGERLTWLICVPILLWLLFLLVHGISWVRNGFHLMGSKWLP